ncbi:hypothetical protein BpHYR1_049395 [Brachionus plicatilis]|uniref:Uncharacterized protein n=1 Tax=Brachionus plicatilis TaxID=10195 RepID=A0A3M7REA2_BRAPC|nr:hypothetical protein BpHYR1_049395 [Brachionus plicatilis]
MLTNNFKLFVIFNNPGISPGSYKGRNILKKNTFLNLIKFNFFLEQILNSFAIKITKKTRFCKI